MHIFPDSDRSDAQDSSGREEDSLWWRIVTGPWLGPIILIIVWVPFVVVGLTVEILQARGSVNPHFGVGYAIGWATVILGPGTIVAICSMLFHLVRAVYRAVVGH